MTQSSLPLTRLTAKALRRARRFEAAARGPARREAFRLSRQLIGASLAIDIPIADLAECLGVRPSSVRERGSDGGWISISAIIALTDVSETAVQRWRAQGILTAETVGADGERRYLTEDFLRAITMNAGSQRDSAGR